MLEKGFLKHKYSFKVTKGRFLISALIGFTASFCIYSFFCLFREFFRTMEFTQGNGPLLFDTATRYTQNLNFAMLGLALGNALFLGVLFRKPLATSLPEYKRLGIMNNQVFLGFNFFYVFAKFFILGGVFMAISFDLNGLSTHFWLFLMIALVLFLESYVTLLRSFRRKAFRAMWINLLILAVVCVPMARTSVFDYKEIDKALLANNPPVDLAATDFKSETDLHWWNILKVEHQSGNVRYRYDGKVTDLRSMPLLFEAEKESYIYLPYRRGIYLLVTKELPMGELLQLERQLWRLDKRRLIYVTKNPLPEFTSRFDFEGVEKIIPVPNELLLRSDNERLRLPPSPPLNEARMLREYVQRKTMVALDIKNGCHVNGRSIPKEELVPYFKQTIDSNVIFNFRFENDLTFQKYIDVYAAYRQALHELRKDDERIERINEWGAYFDPYGIKVTKDIYDEDQERIKDKYPATYLENYSSD